MSTENRKEWPPEQRQEQAEGTGHGGACQIEDLVGTDWAERVIGSCYVGRNGHRASSAGTEPG